MRNLTMLALIVIALGALILSDMIDSNGLRRLGAQERENTVVNDGRGQHLRRYKGETPLPDDLLQVYEEFFKTTRRATAEALAEYCLPGSVKITKAKREKNAEYGEGMNLPFLVSGFNGEISSVHKENVDCYVIRTASSSLRFVKTASSGWKLYHYVDKPIE